ncbi:MAG TPA: hypothetical protein V6D17_06505 [Candidatus Obscuribacterales bacterium]
MKKVGIGIPPCTRPTPGLKLSGVGRHGGYISLCLMMFSCLTMAVLCCRAGATPAKADLKAFFAQAAQQDKSKNYREAIQLYKQFAYEVLKNRPGAAPYLKEIDAAAVRLADAGDQILAEKLLRVSLEAREKSNPQSMEVATVLGELADLCESTRGNLDEKHALLLKRVKILEKNKGDQDRQTQVAKFELALLSLRMGRLAEARSFTPVCPDCDSKNTVVPVAYQSADTKRGGRYSPTMVKAVARVRTAKDPLWYCQTCEEFFAKLD